MGGNLTSDGEMVAFASAASNLVSGDTNGATDIFLKDLSPPSISSIAPSSGLTGSEVLIKGTHFGPNRSSSYVTFGSNKATTYTSWSDTQIKVLVPSGALGATNVKVVTELGPSNTKPFAAIPSYNFAEGYTGDGFHTWLCLQNPNASEVAAQVTYMFRDGGTQVQDLQLPANSRTTIRVNDVVGPGKDVSIRVVSDGQFIVAERPMYFNYQGRWDGGHCVIGATAPSKTIYFAEGCTRSGFEEWLCLMNPNSSPAKAQITYMFGDGGTQPQEVLIGATSRETVSVNAVVGPGKDVSVKITSDQPIVAERPMYFNYASMWDGGHCVIGTDSPATTLYLAEGCTRVGFDEYLCLQNANNTEAHATVTFMMQGGGAAESTFSIPPESRFTLNVNSSVGPEQDVSVKITSNIPLIGERPMYFDFNGITGGHDVIATGSAAQEWYFAEGTTQGGFGQFISIQNPGDEDAAVQINYFKPGGGTVKSNIDLEPRSRYTVIVARDLGPGIDNSVYISSNKPIIAERPMYFNYNGGEGEWDGGHCVMGYAR